MSTFIRTKDGKYSVSVISKSKSDVDMRYDYYVDEYVDGTHWRRITADKSIISKLLRFLLKEFKDKYEESMWDRCVHSADVMVHQWSKKRSKVVWIKPCDKCGYNREECWCKNK